MTLCGKICRILVLIVFAAVALPAAIHGQCPPPPATSPLAEGEVGLFFDPLGTQTCIEIGFGVPTPMYVVVRVPEGGIAQFSIPEIVTDQQPPGLILLGSAALPAGGAYEPLIVIDGCSVARRIDPESCPVSQGDVLPISVISVMALAPVTGTVCFQTACPTIAGIVAMPPFYNRCDTGAQGTFTGWNGMCIGFGEAPVATEPSTWGAIKAVYGE